MRVPDGSEMMAQYNQAEYQEKPSLKLTTRTARSLRRSMPGEAAPTPTLSNQHTRCGRGQFSPPLSPTEPKVAGTVKK